MTEQNQSSYPMISEKAWWTLRDKFIASVPAMMTPSYVVTVLSLKDNSSATSNVITPFRRLQLIDDEGRPTDLAMKWRLDEQYKDACDQMLANTYPRELLDIFSTSDIDKEQAAKWFMRSGVGKDAAKKMASVFALLKRGEVSDKQLSTTANKPKNAKTRNKPAKSSSNSVTSANITPSVDYASSQAKLHIDLQIHISPDSTTEQIEAIFASMAKHLYGNH